MARCLGLECHTDTLSRASSGAHMCSTQAHIDTRGHTTQHARTAAPTIALAMGEKGVITRLLAAKYGGFLTFAAMSPEKASAPGQPSIQSLHGLYNSKVCAGVQGGGGGCWAGPRRRARLLRNAVLACEGAGCPGMAELPRGPPPRGVTAQSLSRGPVSAPGFSWGLPPPSHTSRTVS